MESKPIVQATVHVQPSTELLQVLSNPLLVAALLVVAVIYIVSKLVLSIIDKLTKKR